LTKGQTKYDKRPYPSRNAALAIGANSRAFAGNPMKKITILNGPNLNRLGKREPEIYGTATLKDLERLVRAEARQLGVTVKFFQSNHEGALIDAIHAFADAGTEGFIVNFGAYSHTSIALHDALRSVSRPPSRCTFPTSRSAKNSVGTP
jgi:hypothetical protein